MVADVAVCPQSACDLFGEGREIRAEAWVGAVRRPQVGGIELDGCLLHEMQGDVQLAGARISHSLIMAVTVASSARGRRATLGESFPWPAGLCQTHDLSLAQC